jgi:hypothetical protein
MTAAEIAARLGGARRAGAWWSCRCPAHDDRSPSLSVRDGVRGLSVKCFAGCEPHDVLAELRWRGLIGSSSVHHSERVTVQRPSDDDAARRIEVARRIWNAALTARGTPVERYFAGRGSPPLRRPHCATRPRCGVWTAHMGRPWSPASTTSTAS